MFHIVEYRTISQNSGRTYASRFARIGLHKAKTSEEATDYILRTTQNVEVLSVHLVGVTG